MAGQSEKLNRLTPNNDDWELNVFIDAGFWKAEITLHALDDRREFVATGVAGSPIAAIGAAITEFEERKT